MDEVDSTWSRSWGRAKRTAVEWLAVFISAIGFIFGTIGIFVGLLAMWVAYDANENAKVARLELSAHIAREKE